MLSHVDWLRYTYFQRHTCLFQVDVDESTLSPEELKERKIMKLLLKIKNGTPPMRKAALRQITDKAREFGAGPLFNQILPLLMSPTLEDQVSDTSANSVVTCILANLGFSCQLGKWLHAISELSLNS